MTHEQKNDNSGIFDPENLEPENNLPKDASEDNMVLDGEKDDAVGGGYRYKGDYNKGLGSFTPPNK